MKFKMPPNSNEEHFYQEEKPKPIRVSMKNLPHFDGRPDEDAQNFINKYEMIARFNYWRDKELIGHFHMCLDKAAFGWLVNLNKGKNWPDLKNGFLSFFGKSKDDFVLKEFSAKKYAINDPNLFICQVLDYLAVTDPDATEIRKIDALYDALPRKLKVKFLESDRPKSVYDFSAKLKCFARAENARMRYKNSKDSEGEVHEERQESQILALMTDMQAQVVKLTTALDQIQHRNSPYQQYARPAQHSQPLTDQKITNRSRCAAKVPSAFINSPCHETKCQIPNENLALKSDNNVCFDSFSVDCADIVLRITRKNKSRMKVMNHRSK